VLACTQAEFISRIADADPEGIVRMLRQTDAQLFSGWRGEPCILDPIILNSENRWRCVQPCVSPRRGCLNRLSWHQLSPVAAELEELEKQAFHALTAAFSGKQACKFVFSGCGTSGRIAWLCASSYNSIVAAHHPQLPPLFEHLLSGGDEAMVLSKELPEDDPHLGRQCVTNPSLALNWNV
jgi:hypothetical protein